MQMEFKQIDDKQVLFGACEHLDNYYGNISDCPCKRTLSIYNPINQKYERLIFCNEWLKIEVNMNKHEYSDYRLPDTTYAAKEILRNLVLKYLKSFNVPFSQYGSLDVYFEVCSKPFISISFSLRTAINLYINSTNYDFILGQGINNYVHKWIDTKDKYKKYKSTCEQLRRVSNKLKHGMSDEEKNDITFELVSLILNLKINEAS